MSTDNRIMCVVKVKSATYLYLIFGFISILIISFGVVTMVKYLAINTEEIKPVILLIIPFGLLILMAYTFIKSYIGRKEFEIYIIYKTGIVDFDSMHRTYIQVGDEIHALYFVKKEDYGPYLSYSILNDVTAINV
jgi:hypothetical protein